MFGGGGGRRRDFRGATRNDPGPPQSMDPLTGEGRLIQPHSIPREEMYAVLSENEDEEEALPSGWTASTALVPAKHPFLDRRGRARAYYYRTNDRDPIPQWDDPRKNMPPKKRADPSSQLKPVIRAIEQQKGKAVDVEATMKLVTPLCKVKGSADQIRAKLVQRSKLQAEIEGVGGDGAVARCNQSILQAVDWGITTAISSAAKEEFNGYPGEHRPKVHTGQQGFGRSSSGSRSGVPIKMLAYNPLKGSAPPNAKLLFVSMEKDLGQGLYPCAEFSPVDPDGDLLETTVRVNPTLAQRGFAFVLVLASDSGWVRERGADNKLKIRTFRVSDSWGYATTYSQGIAAPIFPVAELGPELISEMRLQQTEVDAAAKWFSFALQALVDGRLSLLDAVHYILDAAAPSLPPLENGFPQMISGTQLFATEVAAANGGISGANKAACALKYLAMLIVGAMEVANDRSGRGNDLQRNTLSEMSNVAPEVTAVISEGAISQAMTSSARGLLQGIERFAAQRAGTPDIQYLNFIPMMNQIAAQSNVSFQANLNSPYVGTARRGGGDALASEQDFNNAVNFYVSQGKLEEDRASGQRVMPLDVEIARCCPSVNSFQHLLQSVSGQTEIVAGVLGVAHELECFWKHGAMMRIVEYMRGQNMLTGVVEMAAAGMLANFTRVARSSGDGQILFNDLMRCTEGTGGMVVLSSPDLCTALLGNTRAFTDVKVEEILKLVTTVYNRGLDPVTEKAQAKAALSFLEVRLMMMSDKLGDVFNICNGLAGIEFLAETAGLATEAVMKVQDIETLIEVLRTMDQFGENWTELKPEMSTTIRTFVKRRFVYLCENNDRVRVHDLACACLEECTDADLGPMLMKTVAMAGLGFLQTADTSATDALKAMVGNADLLTCCVAYSKSFKKYKAKLEEGDSASEVSDTAAIQTELEALKVEHDIGMIDEMVYQEKKTSLERMLAGDLSDVSPAVQRFAQLKNLLQKGIELMPVRGLTVKLASDTLVKQDSFKELYVEFDIVPPDTSWSTLKEHSDEANTLKRLLDVYANQFVANIRQCVNDALKAFPAEARSILDGYDNMLLSEVRSSDPIQFVLANLEKLERFAYLLTSTMIFPRVRQRILSTVAAGSISPDVMANTTIPSLLKSWDDIANQIIAGEVTTIEVEMWFEQLLDSGAVECKDNKQAMNELAILGNSMQQPDQSAIIQGRLDSFIFLRNQKAFIYDFAFLIESLKRNKKFQDQADPLWESLQGVVETLRNEYDALTLAGIAGYQDVLDRMRRITARMDETNREFINELNVLQRDHMIIDQLAGAKYKFIIDAKQYSMFAGVVGESRDNYDKRQITAFEEFNVIRGLLCNVLAPSPLFDNVDGFIEKVQIEARKLAEDPELIRYIKHSLELLRAVAAMRDGVNIDLGKKDAELLDKVMEFGIWKISSPDVSSGDAHVISAKGVTLHHKNGEMWQKEAGFITPEMSIQDASDLSDRLFLLEAALKEPRNEAIDDFASFIDGVQRLNFTLVQLHFAGNQQDGVDGYSFDFPMSRTDPEYVSIEEVTEMRKNREGSYYAWNKGINHKRKKYVYLNYFTVNQMISIMKDCKTGENAKVLRMLRYISPNVPANAPERLARGLSHLWGDDDEEMLTRTMTDTTRAIVDEGAWAEGLVQIEALGVQLSDIMRNVVKTQRTLDVAEAAKKARRLENAQGGTEIETAKDDALLVSTVLQGIPNSAVAQTEQEIVRVLLTLYAQLKRAPDANEVLICGPKTTTEEVALILGRCSHHMAETDRLYTIAYAHLLNTDTQNFMLSLMRDLKQMGRIGKLVVLSTHDPKAGDGSRLAEALAKFTLTVPMPSDATLSQLLAQMFAAEPVDGATRDRPFVQSYSSNFVGTGKSYQINKAADAHDLPLVHVPVYSAASHDVLINSMNAQPSPDEHVVLSDEDRKNGEEAVEALMKMEPAARPEAQRQLAAELRTAVDQIILERRSAAPNGRALHLMLSPTVGMETDRLLFSLLVLQDLQDHDGYHYQVQAKDNFFVEIPNQCVQDETDTFTDHLKLLHLMPNVHITLDGDTMDCSLTEVQFVCKYLQALEEGDKFNLDPPRGKLQDSFRAQEKNIKAKKLHEVVFQSDPLDSATCRQLLHNALPHIAGSDTPKIDERSMILTMAWIRFTANRWFQLENSEWLGMSYKKSVFEKYNKRADFYQRILEAMEEMANSFTARTISVKSLLEEQIRALDLNPDDEQQSLQLMNTWKNHGIIFQAMFAPNPNDKRAAFWLEFSGEFRPVCLDPAELNEEIRAYWDVCGKAVGTREARMGGGEFMRAADFAFVDYTAEVVTLPKEHSHLKKLYSAANRPKDRTPGEAAFKDFLRQRTDDQKETYRNGLDAETLAAMEAVERRYQSREVTSQDALFELLIDVVGCNDYPGGKDLYKPNPRDQLFELKPPAVRRHIFDTFVLTIDNVFKMLAVYFRLDAGMPVVIMGETGCGKTFSVQYLATVLAFPFFKLDVHGGLEEQNIIDFMWYGQFGPSPSKPAAHADLDEAAARLNSMSAKDREKAISELEDKDLATALRNKFWNDANAKDWRSQSRGPLKVAYDECKATEAANEAERIKWAGKRRKPFRYDPMPVWVFFDEINTCDSVGLFREMVCDRSMNGLVLPRNIKVIAALNPYRLKQQQGRTAVGIAHKNVDQEMADAKGIAFRDLVYVVHPIPRTMLEYIWDYGTLGQEEETRYMRSMLMQEVDKEKPADQAWALRTLMGDEKKLETFTRYFGLIVQQAHNFLRRASGGEVSVVSLRDVARCVKLFGWFRKFLMDKNEIQGHLGQEDLGGVDLACKAFMLALAHCYYFRLQEATSEDEQDGCDRGAFRDNIERLTKEYFDSIPADFKEGLNADDWLFTNTKFNGWLLDQMDWFIRAMSPLPPGIAANVALTENVFMMIVCITCRIPLIVVGNPGTSKTLAASIIFEKLNQFTKAPVFDNLGMPSIQPFSYQCSRHSTADEIERRFVDAVKAQDKANAGVGTGEDILNACVFLDEVGLAEESPHMPLKVLHKLLEKPQVSFIGLSNWNLDPAKMNRAIYLVRPETKSKDLCATAAAIVGKKQLALTEKMGGLADAYLEITHKCAEDDPSGKIGKYKDFIGLRDFYTFVKLLDRNIRENEEGKLTQQDFNRAIMRSFGGMQDVDTRAIVGQSFWSMNQFLLSDFDGVDGMVRANPALELVRENLKDLPREGRGGREPGGRHLMVLSENESGLDILLDEGIITNDDTELILGSAFPEDKTKLRTYHNINQIKEAMKVGKRVVLLHLEALYESLYDMLNQQYTQYLDNTYCRLAVGAQSRFCEVDDKFRCIVVVDSTQAYTTLDAPLLNRFEKQVLSRRELLTEEHRRMEKELLRWCTDFIRDPKAPIVQQSRTRLMQQLHNTFVGFNDETLPSLIRSLEVSASPPEDFMAACKEMLLWIATPESVLRTKQTGLSGEAAKNEKMYFREQEHGSLPGLIDFAYKNSWEGESGFNLFCMTFSPIVVYAGDDIKDQLSVPHPSGATTTPTVVSLESYATVKQLTKDVTDFFEGTSDLLVIQGSVQSAASVQRLMHARYICVTARSRAAAGRKNVILVGHLQKNDSDSGVVQDISIQFSNGWRYAVVDTLLIDPDMPSMVEVLDQSVEDILGADSTGRVNINAILRANMRRCIAYLGYPETLRPEDPMKHQQDLLNLLMIKDFEGLVRTRIGEMITGESLSEGWQSRLSRRDIAAAGTFTIALNRELSGLVVTAFCQWMAVADVNMNLAVYRSAPDGGVIQRVWMDIARDTKKVLAHFPVVTKKMERQPVSITDKIFNPMEAEFPFSNIVYKKVRDVVKKVAAFGTTEMVNAINATPIGEVLGQLDDDAVRHYLKDAVRLARLTTRPVENYQLIAGACIEAFLADQGITFETDPHIVHVHNGISGAEALLRSILELQASMQEDGCAAPCKGIFTAPSTGEQGTQLVGFVQQFLEECIKKLIEGLYDESADHQVRMHEFHTRVASYSTKFQQLFDWVEAAYPDYTEVNHTAQKWVHCKLIADFIKIVCVPLALDEVTEVIELHKNLASQVDGFSAHTLHLLMAFLASITSVNPNRIQCTWEFLEHYLIMYAFHRDMVGECPEEDVLALSVYLASLEVAAGPTQAPEGAGMEEMQDKLVSMLRNLAENDNFEFSTPCRVSLIAHVLGCGSYLEAEDPVAELINMYLDAATETQATLGPPLDECPLDNSFSVLCCQAMEDRMLAQYNALCPPKEEVEKKIKDDPGARLALMKPADQLLVKWAREGASEATEEFDTLQIVHFANGVAKIRIVLSQAAHEVARGVLKNDTVVREDLLNAACHCLVQHINPASDQATRPLELYFMKHLSRELGLQQAVLTLLADHLTESPLRCALLNLKDVLNPGGAHVPNTDPFYQLYTGRDYQEARLKTRIAVRNGSIGCEELGTLLDGLEDTSFEQFYPIFTMGTHFEALLGHGSLVSALRPGEDAKEFADTLCEWTASKTGDTHMKELLGAVAMGGDGPQFSFPYNMFDGMQLDDALSIQPILHLAAKVFAANAGGDGNKMGPFYKLMTDPAFFKDKWIVTMPEDEMAMIINAAGGGQALGVYQCECGYKYVVDACTMPNQSAACPDCGRNIGKKTNGGFHQLSDTSTRLAITGRTHWNTGDAAREAGFEDVNLLGAADAPSAYVAPAAGKEPQASESYRELIPLAFRILRYFVHGSLALAFSANFSNGGDGSAASAADLTKTASEPRVEKATTEEGAVKGGGEIFFERMRDDFRIIKRLANDCTSDDAFVYLHMLIADLADDTFNQDYFSVDGRGTAEKRFQEKLVFNIFSEKNKEETKTRCDQIRAKADTGAQQLALGAELSEAVPGDPAAFSQMLRFRQPITMDGFTFKFQTTVASDFPTLDSFLNLTDTLPMAGDLYGILHFTNLVHNRYAGTITRAAAQRITFWDAIEEVPAEREEWATAFEEFRQVWNKWAGSITAFECRQLTVPGQKEDPEHPSWPGMPYIRQPAEGEPSVTSQGPYLRNDEDGWENAAKAKSISLAVYNSFDANGPSATDPDSCMLKLLVQEMLRVHNNQFIMPARELLEQRGQEFGVAEDDEAPPKPGLPLHMAREVDMIRFTMHDFETAVREHSTQSLKYGQGAHIVYNFQAIQDWVYEHVVANVPVIDNTGREFMFVGEGTNESTEYVAGIKQENVPEEIAGAIHYKELTTLSAQQAALDRLEECIGFLRILGASSGDMNLATYCGEALRLSSEELADFGDASSAFRTAVMLKHVISLRQLLKDIIMGDDLVGHVAPIYQQDQLTEEQEMGIKDLVAFIEPEERDVLVASFSEMLKSQFKDFAEPSALMLDDEPVMLASGFFMAVLDFAPTPDGKVLADMPWFVENFPMDVPLSALVATYTLICAEVAELA